MKEKIIAITLVLILIVSFSGCLGPEPVQNITKDDKIDSKEKASDKTAEVSDDLEGLSGSLKDLDDELG